MIDPLVRGIYYMYLTKPHPSRTLYDKEATDRIKEVMQLHQVSLYSSVATVRQVLIKELLRRSDLNVHARL